MTTKPDTSSPPLQASVSVQPGGPVSGTVRPPGSKSITNRALICAAMARGTSTLVGALQSEDTAVMIDSLQKCGVQIDVDQPTQTIRVVGASCRPESDELIDLFIANSGTSIRFLTAALSALGGNYRLSGVERMHERPIGDLIDALQPIQRGAIGAESLGGCPPVVIESHGWLDKPLQVGGSVSSQYLSGLMMAAPIALAGGSSDSGGVQINVVGELVSRPYVEMTASVMRAFGVIVNIKEKETDSDDPTSVMVHVEGSGYRGSEYQIEPDASAASYFWAAAAITGGSVKVAGLTPDALQGDVDFCKVLEQMGCQFHHDQSGMTISGRANQGIDIDMNQISDTVQTLAVVALFAEGPTTVRGVAHNRFKETDRIGDLACELRKLGAKVNEHDDGLTIVPPTDGIKPAVLQTYHDHRMAMSLSLAGLAAEGVFVLDPACTGKTYPDFFSDLEQLIQRPHHWKSLSD